MADNLKPEDRIKTMRAVKGKGTKIERRIFSMLAGMKLSGWRKNVEDLPGKPDVVFPDEKLALFVDGCFWHGCPQCQRKLPVSNRDYWERKIRRNIELAKIHNHKLLDDGWIVIRIWEHEISDTAARKQIKLEIRKALRMEQSNDDPEDTKY